MFKNKILSAFVLLSAIPLIVTIAIIKVEAGAPVGCSYPNVCMEYDEDGSGNCHVCSNNLTMATWHDHVKENEGCPGGFKFKNSGKKTYITAFGWGLYPKHFTGSWKRFNGAKDGVYKWPYLKKECGSWIGGLEIKNGKIRYICGEYDHSCSSYKGERYKYGEYIPIDGTGVSMVSPQAIETKNGKFRFKWIYNGTWRSGDWITIK